MLQQRYARERAIRIEQSRRGLPRGPDRRLGPSAGTDMEWIGAVAGLIAILKALGKGHRLVESKGTTLEEDAAVHRLTCRPYRKRAAYGCCVLRVDVQRWLRLQARYGAGERRTQMTGVRAFATGIMAVIGVMAVAQEVTVRVIELPAGAIVAFPQACPGDGNWEVYQPAQGRFLIGAGVIRNTGQEIDPTNTGDVSSHDHTGKTGPGGHRRGVDNDRDHWPSANEHTHSITEESHLPPYLAVVFCRLK